MHYLLKNSFKRRMLDLGTPNIDEVRFNPDSFWKECYGNVDEEEHNHMLE